MNRLISSNQSSNRSGGDARFDSVVWNKSYLPGKQSRQAIRGLRASRGGDLSQLGGDRLKLDPRAAVVLSDYAVAYVQPEIFDFVDETIVAVKVSVRMPRQNTWSKGNVATAQKLMAPSQDLTQDEINVVVDKTYTTIKGQRTGTDHQIAAWMNMTASMSANVTSVLERLATIDVLGNSVTGATVAGRFAGENLQQVTQMTSDHMASLSISDIETLLGSKPTKSVRGHLEAILGSLMYDNDETRMMCLGYSPFCDEIEVARVKKEMSISAADVRGLINEEGIVNEEFVVDNVAIEVVKADNVANEHKKFLIEEPIASEDSSFKSGAESEQYKSDMEKYDKDMKVWSMKLADYRAYLRVLKEAQSRHKATLKPDPSTPKKGGKGTPKKVQKVEFKPFSYKDLPEKFTEGFDEVGHPGDEPEEPNPSDYSVGEPSALRKRDVDWIGVLTNQDVESATMAKIESVGSWEVYDVDDNLFLELLALHTMGCYHARAFDTSSMSPESIGVFCNTRANIMNHQLLGSSSEVINEQGGFLKTISWGALLAEHAAAAFEFATTNIMGYVCMAVADISFMKSGHTATANNLSNTFMKIYQSLNTDDAIRINESEVGVHLAMGVYFGKHPADNRASMMFFRRLATEQKLSYSVSRRLTVNGPGTVSLFLLDKIVTQLKHINFFHYMGREDQYTAFKAKYEMYAKTMHLETPYANYMYGKSKSENDALKSSMGDMFAYASALKKVMPESTFANSVALTRDASAAANNTIVAMIEVEAFALAYRRFVRSLVTNQLKSAIKPGQESLDT